MTGNHVVDESGNRRVQQTIGEPGTELWVSWLQRRDRNVGGWHGLNFLRPLSSRTTVGTYFIGEPGSGPGDGMYVIGRGGDDENVVSSGVPAAPGQTAFLVVHLQFREGNDLATLYVNPTPGVAPTGGVTYSGLDQPVLSPIVSFDSIAFPDSNTYYFDELWIGGSYAAVAPLVPEPGTASLIGAAAVLLLLRGRIRRRSAAAR